MRTRIAAALALVAALTIALPLSGCASSAGDSTESGQVSDDSKDSDDSGEDEDSEDEDEDSDDEDDNATPNADPRCTEWTAPLVGLQLFLVPVIDTAAFPREARDATCQFEVAAKSDHERFPHDFEVLWLDGDDATFDHVVAAFERDGAEVDVDESGGPGAGFGAITYATISASDGTGELTLREPTDVLADEFVTLTWVRS
jgi:hypothetical protein